MRDKRSSVSVHLTLYRMFIVALIGLVVGTISSFATIGFVETINWLNQVFYITSESRAGLSSDALWMVTILIPTLGGLRRPNTAIRGRQTKTSGAARYHSRGAIARKTTRPKIWRVFHIGCYPVIELRRFGGPVRPAGLPRNDGRSDSYATESRRT